MNILLVNNITNIAIIIIIVTRSMLPISTVIDTNVANIVSPSVITVQEKVLLAKLSPLAEPFHTLIPSTYRTDLPNNDQVLDIMERIGNCMELFRSIIFPYEVIIAHGPGCKDGTTAAWCWWRRLPLNYRCLLAAIGDFYDYSRKTEMSISKNENTRFDTTSGALRLQAYGFPVVFAFVQPNTQIPINLIKDRRVLILDLDLGIELLPVITNAAFTMLCDHHTSTLETIKNNVDKMFAKDKFGIFVDTRKIESGASLSWKLSHNTRIPLFIDIVRIGDNWQFDENPNVQAKAVLRTMHLEGTFTSFPAIEQGFELLQTNYLDYVNRGIVLLQYDQQIIKTICKQCDLGSLVLNDGTRYTIAYTQCNVMHSEVGASMKFYAQKRFANVKIHLCATWKYVSHRNMISVSLRDGDEGIDLALVAREVVGTDKRGGGHDTSASFMFQGLENFHKFIQYYTFVK